MATATDVAAFADAARDVRTLAVGELSRFWATLDVSDAMAVRAAVEEFLPLLVARYGNLAATVAADWYDELRDRAAPRRRFTATLADTPPAEAVRINGRWAIGPVFSTTPDGVQAAHRLAQVVDRMALQAGRDTIALSVARDPSDVRWARVPTGAETCAFCLMLASRGAEYRSRASAGGTDSTRYHADCGCVPTPMWPGDDYPAGYDPDALYERYLEASDAAGTGSPKAVLSKLRELEGIH